MSKIAVIMGSTRPKRFCEYPTQWIVDEARKRPRVNVDVLDLRDFPLPFYQEPVSPANNKGIYASEVAFSWAKRIADADGFIIVTPEYNHSFPAVLKNALDHAYHEWSNKPVAFVGYGGLGGARAVEQLRLVAVELQMAPIKNAVHIPVQVYLAVAQEGKSISSFDYLQAGASALLTQLEWWTDALKTARHQRALVA